MIDKQLPPAVFEEICGITCPECRLGHAPTQRQDTKEWVHNRHFANGRGGSTFSHSLCAASNLRNSEFAGKE